MKKSIFFISSIALSLSLFAQQKITFPCDIAAYLGQEVEITNPLVVVNNYDLKRYGQLTLASSRQYSGVENHLPASAAWSALISANNDDRLELAKSTRFNYLDQQGTRRTGATLKNLTGKVVFQYGKYMLEPTVDPQFEGGERPLTIPDLGNHNLKVASVNLEFYIADPAFWATSNGAKTAAEFAIQREKTLRALIEMDAQIYALCELGEGAESLKNLTAGLNEFTGSTRFKYVEDNNTQGSKYTKNGFIYDAEKVRPYGPFLMNSVSGVTHLNRRRVATGFELIANGERLVINMNHFLSKSSTGTGDNADSGDGQGSNNGTRVREATATLSFLNLLESTFGDKDILVTGDLNCYSMEDPMRILLEGGLINHLKQYAPDGYSYSYKCEVGYIDHSLSTHALSTQITGAAPWHVNADEPAFIGYKSEESNPKEPFRFSDHEPILTGIFLGGSTGILSPEKDATLVVSGNAADGYLTLQGEELYHVSVYDLSGMLVYAAANPEIGSYFVLPTDSFKNGYYLVKALGKQQQQFVAKVLINR